MKILYFIAYVYHRLFRFFHRRIGKYQTIKFQDHHHKMKKYKGLLLIIGIVLFLCAKSTTADFESEEMKSINVAKSLAQSTVIITANGGIGSGFYISDNEIITNQHVVEANKSVFIEKSTGTMCLGDVIFAQIETDLALIKTDCKGKPLKLANNVKVGQSVLAMGNPLNQGLYLSKGIVGLLRGGEILHSAVTDKGMSGGPVVDLNGQLVGVIQASANEFPKMSIAIDTKTLSYFLYQAKGE